MTISPHTYRVAAALFAICVPLPLIDGRRAINTSIVNLLWVARFLSVEEGDHHDAGRRALVELGRLRLIDTHVSGRVVVAKGNQIRVECPFCSPACYKLLPWPPSPDGVGQIEDWYTNHVESFVA